MRKKKTADGLASISAKQFVEKLQTYASAVELKMYHRYFTFDESGKADTFIGVRMGQVFALAKEFIAMLPGEIEKLLESPIHEVRVGGVSIMDFQARSKKTLLAHRQELYDLYLRRHDRINNWDLVDRAAPYVIGSYLFDLDKPRKILYKLAASKDTWERRTAIVSTLYLIGKGEVDDAFKIAEILLNDDEDLIHKGTGWALRYAGDKDPERLLSFLDKYAVSMPRITLRYAIEHLDKKQKEHYMSMKKVG
ncbi:MAG: DNA alkylation repair protein [Chloroflexota bacterium]|nr:DNA alkylation repair protein [Chloroflexota bacterium]